MSTLKPLRLKRLQGKAPFALEITPTADGQRVATPRGGRKAKVELPKPNDAPNMGKLRMRSSSNRQLLTLLGGESPGKAKGVGGKGGAGDPAGGSLFAKGEMHKRRPDAASLVLGGGGGGLAGPTAMRSRPVGELGGVGGRGGLGSLKEPSSGIGVKARGLGAVDRDAVLAADRRVGAMPVSLDRDGRSSSAAEFRGLGQDRSRTELPPTGSATRSASSLPVLSGGPAIRSGFTMALGDFDATPISSGGSRASRSRDKKKRRKGEKSKRSRSQSKDSQHSGKGSEAGSEGTGSRMSSSPAPTPVPRASSRGKRKASRKPPALGDDTKVLLEGHLLKMKTLDGVVEPDKMWQKRFFQLRDGFLLFFHHKKHTSKKPSGWIDVDTIESMRVSNRKLPGTDAFTIKCCFTVTVDDGRSMHMRARSSKEARHWMKAINVARGLMNESELEKYGKRRRASLQMEAPKGAPSPKARASAARPVILNESEDNPEESYSVEDASGEAAVPTRRPSPSKVEKDDDADSYSDVDPEDGKDAAPARVPLGGGDYESGEDKGEWKETFDELTQSKHFVNLATAESHRDEVPATEDAEPADKGHWVKAWDFNAKCPYYYHTVEAISTYDKPEGFVEEEAERPEELPPSGWGWGAGAVDTSPTAATIPQPKTEEAERFGSTRAMEEGARESTPEIRPGSGKPAARTSDASAASDVSQEHWIECWDETYNCPYYVNAHTDESVWERPTGDKVVITQYAGDTYEEDIEDETEEPALDADWAGSGWNGAAEVGE